ncbi:MAG: oxygenase MpaB family protein [Ardenticatenaceae bacterium]
MSNKQPASQSVGYLKRDVGKKIKAVALIGVGAATVRQIFKSGPPERTITRRIAELDPVEDHQKIAYLLSCYEFPWDIERSLEFALFRTYAVPSISGLLHQTGEFTQRPRKRYDDTELILSEILEHGYDSERGRAALRRMNQMHGRYAISNDDFLYVLSTFVYEPIRWIERFGWRALTEAEKLAMFHYYRQVGRRMNIKNIPESYEAFEQFNINYERTHFQYAPANYEVGVATRDLFLGMYLPKFLWPLAKPLVYAMMDEPLLDGFAFPKPPPLLRRLMQGALKWRGKALRWLPERQTPHLLTQVKRPTYPEGYKIEELGTFPCPMRK